MAQNKATNFPPTYIGYIVQDLSGPTTIRCENAGTFRGVIPKGPLIALWKKANCKLDLDTQRLVKFLKVYDWLPWKSNQYTFGNFLHL